MYSLILLLLISSVRTQQDMCKCSCCTGQSCNPTYMGSSYIPACRFETCHTYCRSSYALCQTDYPYGQTLSECSSNASTIAPFYSCRCDCCRTGSASCTPFFVGYSTTYVCQPSSCSISCATLYPNQCPSDQSGQTDGTCTGLITTTTSTTTVSTPATGSWLGNTCECMCCQSGPNCIPNTAVGNAAVSQCSSAACTAACQNQYPSACPSMASLGQTNGTCTSQNSGNTRCRCQCCGTDGCPTYYVYTNAGCTSCNTLCQRGCGNTNTVTYSCDSNRSNKSIDFSLPLIIFVTLLIVPFSAIF